jgi:hypothetical protein
VWRRVGADRGEVVQLAAERKHLTGAIKGVAHPAETDLVRRIRTAAARTTRPASSSSPCSQPLSSRHRTAMLAALCAEPDARAPHFPRAPLRVRHAGLNPDIQPAGYCQEVWNLSVLLNPGERLPAGPRGCSA